MNLKQYNKLLCFFAASIAITHNVSATPDTTATWNVIDSGDVATLSGIVTAAPLIKTGSGKGILTGSSNAIQGAVIQAGTLQLNNPTPFGSGNTSSTIEVDDGATLAFNFSAGSILANPIQVGHGSANASVILSNVGGTFTLSGQLSQPNQSYNGNVIFTGGAFILSGTNNFTGSNSVNPLSGTITVGSGATLNLTTALSSSSTLQLSGGTLVANVDVTTASSALTANTTFSATSATTLALGTVTGNHDITIGTSGKVGTVSMTDGRTSGATIVAYGTLLLAAASNNTGSITLNAGTTLTVANAVTISQAITFS